MGTLTRNLCILCLLNRQHCPKLVFSWLRLERMHCLSISDCTVNVIQILPSCFIWQDSSLCQNNNCILNIYYILSLSIHWWVHASTRVHQGWELLFSMFHFLLDRLLLYCQGCLWICDTHTRGRKGVEGQRYHHIQLCSAFYRCFYTVFHNSSSNYNSSIEGESVFYLYIFVSILWFWFVCILQLTYWWLWWYHIIILIYWIIMLYVLRLYWLIIILLPFEKCSDHLIIFPSMGLCGASPIVSEFLD
jgi:hypothetical protein